MTNEGFDYYIHDGPTAFRLQLAGNLNEDGARRLEQVWRTATSLTGDKCPNIDITFVTGIDERGRELLAGWHRAGAQLLASSKVSRALAEQVLGRPLGEPVVNARARRPWSLAFLICPANWRQKLLRP
jgi:hypothetical protein